MRAYDSAFEQREIRINGSGSLFRTIGCEEKEEEEEEEEEGKNFPFGLGESNF